MIRAALQNHQIQRLCVMVPAVLAGMACMSPALAGKPDLLQLKPRSIEVSASRLKGFRRLTPDRVDFGPLRFRGGLVLTSPSPYFGGFSGLSVSADGGQMLAVTDAGVWMRADLRYSGDGLTGLQNSVIGPLKALNDRALRRPVDRDAEAIRMVRGSFDRGTALVSFERNHRIGVFRVRKGQLSGPARYLRLPSDHRRMMTRNKGFEAVGQFFAGPLKGQVLAIAERRKGEGKPLRGWLLSKGKSRPVRIAKRDGFDVTDLITLRNGGALLLERRFRLLEGVRMRLRFVSARALLGDEPARGRELLTANQSYQIDNMEGLAAHRTKDGKLVLTLISDNNFNATLQRTLLLQFELDEVVLDDREPKT